MRAQVGQRGRSSESRRRSAPEPAWAEASDDELLAMRFRDLGLRIDGTWIQPMVDRLYDEMEQRGLRFRPHVWLSNEWFSPDGVPGVAIPFYLAHPRLMKLERKKMFEVEGGTREWFMRILRHEAGHAIDTAYRLRRRRRWQELFGRASKPYPQSYSPDPKSHAFVHNLEWWYAQSHPVEDFAETFAVWLRPKSPWKARYKTWRKAYAKLLYVCEVMEEVATLPAPVRSRQQIDRLTSLRQTLGEHYVRRRAFYGVEEPDIFDANLVRVFGEGPARNGSRGESAATFLRRSRAQLRKNVAQWTGLHPYTVDQFLRAMTHRARAMDLRVSRPLRAVRLEAAILLTVQAMNYSRGRRYRVAL